MGLSCVSVAYTLRQLPVRPAYAMTIAQAQVSFNCTSALCYVEATTFCCLSLSSAHFVDLLASLPLAFPCTSHRMLQGNEYDSVVLNYNTKRSDFCGTQNASILPGAFYTGISRAKQKLSLNVPSHGVCMLMCTKCLDADNRYREDQNMRKSLVAGTRVRIPKLTPLLCTITHRTFSTEDNCLPSITVTWNEPAAVPGKTVKRSQKLRLPYIELHVTT